MIALVDYDAGNLHSAAKALALAGADLRITADPADIAAAAAVVLPGVGALPDAMAKLRRRGLAGPLTAFAASGRPLLGICVGLQALFQHGEEGAGCVGLGVLPGEVVRVPAGPGLKVPHMGWNALRLHRGSPLLTGVAPGDRVYFVHAYHAEPAEPRDLVATSEYGGDVTAAVQRGRCFGVQFHPEKSGAVGLRILANFVALAAAAAA